MKPTNPARNSPGDSTRAVHGGEAKLKPEYSITEPIVYSSASIFPETQDMIDFMKGETERVEEYSRYGSPTRNAVQKKLADLSGGEAALLFSSGMAAVTTTLMALVTKNSHIIFTDDIYRKTRQFAKEVLQKFEIEYDMVSPSVEAISAALRPNTDLIFSESPTNPYLSVVDLEQLVELAQERQIRTVLDATFATPYNQKPLEFGVDLVLHSATKYLGGHNDLMAGYIAGGEEIVASVKEYQGMFGPVPGPLTCYLLARGLKTFALRMARHNENGQKVAEFLEAHPKVVRTYYPGLPSHPSHEIAARQMKGFGGVVSFEVDGSLEDCARFVDAMELPYIAPSFGGVESLIGQPALMSFFDLSSEERLEIGIKDNLVRLALGIEDPEDLVADLRQALDQL